MVSNINKVATLFSAMWHLDSISKMSGREGQVVSPGLVAACISSWVLAIIHELGVDNGGQFWWVFIRDAHSKDFRPIFDQFSLQFLFNFTANLTFFAVKMKEN